jgi:hypothetical protein
MFLEIRRPANFLFAAAGTSAWSGVIVRSSNA